MADKKNILHLLSWFPTANDPTAGNFCLKQIQTVSDEVNSVILSATIDAALLQKKEIEIIDYQNFKHILIHRKPSRFPIGIIAKIINKWRLFRAYNWGLKYVKKYFFVPDLVHLHVTLPVGKIAYFWWKMYKIPYILTEHWTIYQPQNCEAMTGKTLRNIVKIANHAQKILPVSADLQKNMQRYGITAPFRVVYNVVNTQLFTIKEKSPHQLKHLLHISTLRDEAKNFSGLLRVIRQLSTQRQDFVLDVVHDYPKPEFEAYVRQNDLQKFVVFHGKKSEKEIAQFYADADFFVLFSNFENLPCVIVESFACGLPVVTTDVGGIGEIVDSKRGMLLSAKDEATLFRNVNYMLDHYESFSQQEIRNYACEQFSQEVIGKQIKEVYREVLKQPLL